MSRASKPLQETVRAPSAPRKTVGAQIDQLVEEAVAAAISRVKKVSQRTVEPVLGIGGRTYLESLPAYERDGGVVARLGKLRLVSVDDYCRWLDRIPAKPVTEAANDTVESDVEALERELGITGAVR